MRDSRPSDRLFKVVGAAIALAATAFFIVFAVRNIGNVPPMDWGPTSVAAWAASIALVVASVWVVGCIWLFLLRDNGVTVGWKRAQAIFAVAQFGKYLPGNVGQHIGRVLLAREAGIPVSVTVSTMLIEFLWGVGVAAVLSLAALMWFFDVPSLGWLTAFGPAGIAVLAAVTIVTPWAAIRFVNAFLPGLAKRVSEGGRIPEPRPQTALLVAGLFVVCFFLIGLILTLQVRWLFHITGANVVQLTCLFAVAWIAGYLTPGAPGGLGVREAVMLLLLPPVIGSGAAIGLGVTLRIATTLGDAIAFALGMAMRHRLSKPSRPDDSQ